MDVKYPPDARQWPGGLSLLEGSSELLANILGPLAAPLVKAEWNRIQDHRGRTLYRLTIRDSVGNVFTDFTPDELQNSLHMRVRLPRLWGDLLQIRSDMNHRKVQIISDQITPGLE